MTPDPSRPAIRLSGLGKQFGGQWAARDIDLEVGPGQVFGFLGANGAGKTTTIRLLLGLLRPTAGTAAVLGHDVVRQRIAAARLTGSLLEARATYDHLTGHENLDTTRRLLGLPAAEIGRVLSMVDLNAAAHRKVGHYSLGMRQRLGLARALLGHPKLLVLDEPMNGLDPDGIRDMRAAIRALPDQGVTVFLSSHLLAEVQQTASHIGLMQAGRLVLTGKVADLLRRAAPDLFIRTGETARALTLLGPDTQVTDEGLRLPLPGGDAQAADIARRLVEAGVPIAELTQRPPTLEDLYLRMREAA